MKIAILGGGFTGLTAAYYLAKKGHSVTIFEKEHILGGLAQGFKAKNWNWYLERTYHHLFANDYDILNFAKETGYEKIIFRSPETASLYWLDEPLPYLPAGRQVFPLDTPLDLLRFPLLSFPDKIRAGITLGFLKLSPFLSLYEKETAEMFLKKTMGIHAWNTLWQELFRKKFGKYAENVLTSFIWARIKKRTKSLGYVEGGFQMFINYVEEQLKSLRVNVLTGYEINKIEKRKEKFQINSHPELVSGSNFDIVISTLPTVIMGKITQGIFPQSYLKRFQKLNYLYAVVLIIESKNPILEKTYWLNICTEKLPLVVLCQHTNFMDKKNYGGNHLAYLGWYVRVEDRLWKMENRELLEYISPYVSKISNFLPIQSGSNQFSNFKSQISNSFLFRGPFAQPIFDKDFIKNKPDFKTPVKNFYIANLDMTYPYDRGTNYAVKLGKQVSEMI